MGQIEKAHFKIVIAMTKKILKGNILLMFITIFFTKITSGQSVFVNLAMLDGIELKSGNVLNYQIINNSEKSRDAKITGTIIFRGSSLRLAYTFNTILYPGVNQFSNERVNNIQWTYSDQALNELFFNYGKLPQGTYEYCVQLQLQQINGENILDGPIDACTYYTVNDIFLINLVDPENNAKIYEEYPVLTWMVNYPFASELTYRLRVAEVKKGQSNESAITRNNPVYQETGLRATTQVYPVTAKPLEKFQPYAWTVDAYYKNILLGGAEAWRFTIIEDSLLQPKKENQSYYEFAEHIGETRLKAYGELKLKYFADGTNDTLFLVLRTDKGEVLQLPDQNIYLKNGYNWMVIQLYEKAHLKQNGKYDLLIRNKANKTFVVPFTYQNPLFEK